MQEFKLLYNIYSFITRKSCARKTDVVSKDAPKCVALLHTLMYYNLIIVLY